MNEPAQSDRKANNCPSKRPIEKGTGSRRSMHHDRVPPSVLRNSGREEDLPSLADRPVGDRIEMNGIQARQRDQAATSGSWQKKKKKKRKLKACSKEQRWVQTQGSAGEVRDESVNG
ncbi:RING finger membrane protein [Pseudozyma hubeiensis SY62]|uniref:RING finger membrane protein n=1 Tax=Pseudozyma hubeiensis (strain SY62) TaxID=1305764 RepID=R9PBM2_PSEHS|nr:RING finger membrane protein [Pseudozyma hubeiensis SY62]GAC98744.1 RING finger membrane protein [Pseudozyma hubeiensis SY62]